MKQSKLSKNRKCNECHGTYRFTAQELRDHSGLERRAKRAGIILAEPSIIIPSNQKEGKLAVAHVIMNRVNKWKKSVADVCLRSFQFSAWNTDSPTRLRLDDIDDRIMEVSHQAAVQAYDSQFQDDPTHGATHYLNIPLTRQLRGGTLPLWVAAMVKTVDIGQHSFYKEL